MENTKDVTQEEHIQETECKCDGNCQCEEGHCQNESSDKGGFVTLTKKPRTRVFVQNSAEAEKLFDHIFESQNTSIEKLFENAKYIEDHHLPVKEELLDKLMTDGGNFIQVMEATPFRLQLTDGDNIVVGTYLESIECPPDEEHEACAIERYVYSLYIMDCIVIQTYSDNLQEIIFFKGFCNGSHGSLVLAPM